MSRLQAILAAEQILNDEQARKEGRKRLAVADRQEAERLRLQKEQSDNANERARISMDLQNRQLDMADRRYQDDLALKDASSKQAQEHYSRFVIPYEESKLKDFNADNEQKLKAKQAYEATHAKYDASGLTDLIHGLESGGDKKNLLAKFNSIKGTYADDVRPSNGGYEVFAGGERIAYIAPEIRNSIMSRKHGGDVRNDGTIAGTSTKASQTVNLDSKAQSYTRIANALEKMDKDMPTNEKDPTYKSKMAIRNSLQAQLDRIGKEMGGSDSAPAGEAAQNARNRRAFENLGKENVTTQQASSGRLVIGAGGSFDEQAKALKETKLAPNEIRRKVGDRIVIYDANTKEPIRYEDEKKVVATNDAGQDQVAGNLNARQPAIQAPRLDRRMALEQPSTAPFTGRIRIDSRNNPDSVRTSATPIKVPKAEFDELTIPSNGVSRQEILTERPDKQKDSDLTYWQKTFVQSSINADRETMELSASKIRELQRFNKLPLSERMFGAPYRVAAKAGAAISEVPGRYRNYIQAMPALQ